MRKVLIPHRPQRKPIRKLIGFFIFETRQEFTLVSVLEIKKPKDA